MWHKCEDLNVIKTGGRRDWERDIMKVYQPDTHKQIAALDEMDLDTEKVYTAQQSLEVASKKRNSDFVHKVNKGDTFQISQTAYPFRYINKQTKWEGRMEKIGKAVYDKRAFYSYHDNSGDENCYVTVNFGKVGDITVFHRMPVKDFAKFINWKPGMGPLAASGIEKKSTDLMPIEAALEVEKQQAAVNAGLVEPQEKATARRTILMDNKDE